MIGPAHGVAAACTLAPYPQAPAVDERASRRPRPPAAAPPAVFAAEDVERLYRSHGHVVLRWARAILGDEDDAQEALQEVFAALLRAAGDMARVESVIGWLYGATTHHCLNLLRHRRNGARLLQRNVALVAPAAVRARADARAEVCGLLGRLPEEMAAAVAYHHLAGMTYDEVAVQLGCSRRKVGYLLQRALEEAGEERAGGPAPGV